MKQPWPLEVRKWLIWYALSFGVWTVLAFLVAVQAEYTRVIQHSPSVGLRAATEVLLLNYWAAAILTPPIIWLAYRFGFAGDRRMRAVMFVLGMSLFCLFQAALRVAIGPVHEWTSTQAVPIPASLDVLFRIFHRNLWNNVWTYSVLVLMGAMLRYAHDMRSREMRESRLRAQLAEARLSMLRMQLNPHFLFNTLNAIATLMLRDVATARIMTFRLSELLRGAIEDLGQHEVALKHELEMLDRYLEIEKARYGERLSVEFDIGPEVHDAAVPNLLLQPIVENSIVHGVGAVSGPGKVRIAAFRRNGSLIIQVDDNGPGLSAGLPNEGVGIRNTRSRLEELYGDEAALRFSTPRGGGMRVEIETPFIEIDPGNSQAPDNNGPPVRR